MRTLQQTLIVLVLFAAACKPKPQPIQYASDACHFCKMTIVSKPFSSELVTTKGKVYKFDAIECMVNHLKADSTTAYAHYLVHDLEQPEEGFMNAQQAVFLISDEIQSPMGANLSAHKDSTFANAEGKWYHWSELRSLFNNGQH